jgi:hypothetical protein
MTGSFLHKAVLLLDADTIVEPVLPTPKQLTMGRFKFACCFGKRGDSSRHTLVFKDEASVSAFVKAIQSVSFVLHDLRVSRFLSISLDFS